MKVTCMSMRRIVCDWQPWCDSFATLVSDLGSKEDLSHKSKLWILLPNPCYNHGPYKGFKWEASQRELVTLSVTEWQDGEFAFSGEDGIQPDLLHTDWTPLSGLSFKKQAMGETRSGFRDQIWQLSSLQCNPEHQFQDRRKTLQHYRLSVVEAALSRAWIHEATLSAHFPIVWHHLCHQWALQGITLCDVFFIATSLQHKNVYLLLFIKKVASA